MPNVNTSKVDLAHNPIWGGASGKGASVMWEPITPLVNIPYFGTQARFSDFFAAVIKNYFPTLEGVSYMETNSGNCDSSFLYATKYGMKVTTNDLGLYSYYTAQTIGGTDTDFDIIDKAAYCAALVDVMGSYTPDYLQQRNRRKLLPKESRSG